MRVLVCGGRDNWDRSRIFEALDKYLSFMPDLEICQGGADGVDLLTFMWARLNNVKCRTFKADWVKYGKEAGSIRNLAMLAEFSPDTVVAFKGGPGTRHMIREARRQGVPVVEVKA